jgi:hypothetical protein
LLVDLAGRAADLQAHYTDAGVLPRGAFRLHDWGFAWSLHMLGGTARFEGILFGLAALAALALLVGYRTFWATLASLVMAVSLHSRNPLLRDGQDVLLRVLLFWGLFLPLGARASWDCRRGSPRPVAVFSPGTVGLIVQIVVIYVVAAISKLESEWWRSGQGLALSLSLGRYETALGQAALHHPRWLWLGNHAILVLEAALPFVFLCSLRARTWVIAVFVCFHLGLIPMLRLGIFPLVSVTCWCFLLPDRFWSRLRSSRSDDRQANEVSAVTRAQASPSARPDDRQTNQEAARATGGTLSRAVVAAALILVVACNARDLGVPIPAGRALDLGAAAVGLNQFWVLFAPRYRRETARDGWWVYVGDLANGDRVDLAAPSLAPPRWSRPPIISETFANSRWRHYMANITIFADTPPVGWTYVASRRAYARYLCRHWRGPPLKHATIFFLYHDPLGGSPKVRATRLAEAECTESDASS